MMKQTNNLSLVHMDDLIKEIQNRTEDSIVVYTRYEDSGHPLIRFAYAGNNIKCAGLATYISDIILRSMIDDEDNIQGSPKT